MTDASGRKRLSGAIVWIFVASSIAMIASTTPIVPPPENYQLVEYAWLKEDGKGAEYWWQHNNTGWNRLDLTYRFSRCNIAYVARSTGSGGFNVTFIVYHNSSASSGFNATGHLYPGSQPNWTMTIPAQYQQGAGQYIYHLFITTFDPRGLPGIYQVRINETGPGYGSNWTTPGGNPDVQWMFFLVPTAEPAVNVTDQLGRSGPFFIDGASPSTAFNATLVIQPPGNSTGTSTVAVEWLDPAGSTIINRTVPIYYVAGVGWVAQEVVPANATAFPANGTHAYSVRMTTGYFVGSASFKVLSSKWITVGIDVEPTHGQWFDPSSFKVTFWAVVNTGLPGNPYQDVDNLTLQFWNSSDFIGVVANLSWNITGYVVVPGSSYTYTWNGMIPASWIDTAQNGSREFFGDYMVRSVPTPGMHPATMAQKWFYVDDPIEAYTSLERASSAGRSAFKAGSTIWINIELDPIYLRCCQHANREFASKEVTIIWDWPNPPPSVIKQETVTASNDTFRPSDQYWAFSTINTSITDPDGWYTIRASIQCDTGYTVWELKYYEIYQSYTPPTEAPNLPPYTTIRPKSNTSWHTIPIQIKLNAADPAIGNGTGVQAINYQIDHGPVHSITQNRVYSFWALEGNHIYTYWSEDRAGNLEIPKSAIIKVDTTPPETTILPPPGPDPYAQPITIQLIATDPDPGSGIDGSFYMIDSSEPMEYPQGGFPAMEGDHNYSYWSLDKAGNSEGIKRARLIAIPEKAFFILLAPLCLLIWKIRLLCHP